MSEIDTEKCPRCGSPDPGLHPAMQFGGEVQMCPDPWHRVAKKEGDDVMKRHQYGDGPVEMAYRREMEAVARVLDLTFNADAKGPERKTGFVLLVFPFNEREGRCNYISNGASRADIIKLLREQANRFESDAGQVGHA